MFGRKINIFEKILLPVGIALTFLGFYLILLAEQSSSLLNWIRLATLFSWMMLLFIIIVTATTEDMKEELALIQKEHVTEIKILKEISHDQLNEIKLLRQDLQKRKK
ncbi:hypothetical protein HN789_00300 [archaeon]|jgi:hypothetical protein|nr:hypothetical protein [archaeon]MBT3721065.1 hypothetical protein [archaeon]MBT4023166.1 hypothetical protein [archaeon]MBT4272372.1 hypothetical protein [archaeon]MBT4460719.1 hypothetical protein [archaeon]